MTINYSAGHIGPKEPATGQRAVCSSQHPIATDTMLEVMRSGGNAVDAGIAGSLVQATIQQEITNHAGTISFLYWEAATGKVHELKSMGTIVPGLPPFRPVPPGKGWLTTELPPPCAVIPGFMPGLKALYNRFATRPWAELCQPAIRLAEDGYEVGSLEHLATVKMVDLYLYTASGREHFQPDGYLPQVGDRWQKPELAKTLRRLADEGPDYFITGEWGQRFVQRANQLGWPIELKHMEAIPPRWGEGLRYRHRGHEIVQLSPPETAGVYCALVLGVLDKLGVTSLGHYTESAEALYYVAHALRRADKEIGFINDPEIFANPTETLLAPEFHGYLADILRHSKPKIDLTEHLSVTAGHAALAGARTQPPSGSCELSIVDQDGNWVQMLNTLQSGGIPGEVVDGVPMTGSSAETSMDWVFNAWFTGGGRMRSIIGHALVLDDGEPAWSLGSVGFPHWFVSQVLLNGLSYGMDPYQAEDAPRMLPLTDDYKLPIESRLSPTVVADLAKLGVLVDPLHKYEWASGSQMSWRDKDGSLHSTASPRNAGSAAGF